MRFTQTMIAQYHNGRTALPFFVELVVAVENMLKEFIELNCVYVLTELGHIGFDIFILLNGLNNVYSYVTTIVSLELVVIGSNSNKNLVDPA